MSKITEDACLAFNQFRRFRRGNTRVLVEGDTAYMFLHGHIIAKRDNARNIRISNAGYATAVTKARLNGLAGVNIHSIGGDWYLNGDPWNGGFISVRSEVSSRFPNRYNTRMEF